MPLWDELLHLVGFYLLAQPWTLWGRVSVPFFEILWRSRKLVILSLAAEVREALTTAEAQSPPLLSVARSPRAKQL